MQSMDLLVDLLMDLLMRLAAGQGTECKCVITLRT